MTENSNAFEQNGGQILSFLCGGNFYGFELTAVTDIIEIPEITKVPKLPDYISGLINLRGKAVPVVDFRKRLGLSAGIFDDRSCIIIVEINSAQAGIICDRVSDVENVLPEMIAPSPVENGLVRCFITHKKKRISLLNHKKIFNKNLST
ncbi:MAG: chemotaxis protein CheW [Hominimerdicola sp.]